VVVLVDGVAVRVAGAVRDPGARGRSYDRLERRDQDRSPALDLDHVVLAPRMDVGLAVRDDQHLVALQVLAQDAPQRVGTPARLRLVARAPLRFEVEHQRLQVAGDRPQLGEADFHATGERSSVSPFTSAFSPEFQPRQLISAMITVISATTVAIAAKR
jgi:hypothetical protein